MKFVSDFEKSAFIERCAWKNFLSIYDAFPGWEQVILPYEGKEVYDVLLFKIDNGYITKRVFVEIKVREVVYDEYFLETKKYNSIKRLCEKELYLNKEDYKILYVNFTPTGTYIWDTDIVNELTVSKQEMNKATMNSRDNKITKTKYDLPINKAKRYGYVWDEGQLKKHYDEYFNGRVEKVVKKNKGLEDILFN